MNAFDLRLKYPKFIYEKYEYQIVNNNLEIQFFYSILPDHKFIHKISIPNLPPASNNISLDSLIFHIGLSLMPSYWKLTCSPLIEIQAGALTPDQIAFWEKLLLKGMGEYFFKNDIDFTYKDFLTINSTNTSPHPSPKFEEGAEKSNRVLVPVGGGKDSIVTLELLKPKYQVVPFIINPIPVMLDICRLAGFDQPVVFKSTIDPYLLKLNQEGYLNGHVPISAFYAFTSVLASLIFGCKYIAISNERSSFESNVEYLNREINHQYSKTMEFETDFSQYLSYLSLSVSYFSFLRPLYELQITKIFSKYPQYFPVFTSCNQNFKLTTYNLPPTTKWCAHCPKCVSTALLLAAWVGKLKVAKIMGSYPPDIPENSEILKELLGINPVKPFECVLTRDEAKVALDIINQGLTDNSRLFLKSWLDNPNMPPEFENLLRETQK